MTELDSYLTCTSCKKSSYALFRVRSPENPDVFVHRLWPVGDAPVPDHPHLVHCPQCGRELTRSAKRA